MKKDLFNPVWQSLKIRSSKRKGLQLLWKLIKLAIKLGLLIWKVLKAFSDEGGVF